MRYITGPGLKGAGEQVEWNKTFIYDYVLNGYKSISNRYEK